MNRPVWLIKEKIIHSLDARPILARGEHPLERVQMETSDMNPGEIYEIITPFMPSPLIAKIAAGGFETYSEEGSDGLVRSYFIKR